MSLFSRKFALVILSIFMGTSTAVLAQDNDFKISGVVYFDYMHGISSDGPRTNGADNGFDFRRAYFTVDKNIDETFSMRFRTDVDRKAGGSYNNNGDKLTATDIKLRPFVKHLYLKWNELLPSSALYVGISGTPTFGISESYWGYRGLAKTIWDQFKDVTGVSASSSSAAVGLALKGSLMEKKITYHSMISNGPGYSGAESNQYKKFYQSVAVNFDGLILEGYVDYEAQDPKNNNITYKGFAGYQAEGMAFGAEYYIMDQGVKDLMLNAFSIFGRYDIMENGTAIVRYDMYDPNADANDNETGLVIVAFDYRPGKGVSVIPNINYYTNTIGGMGSDKADIIGNLTFVWQFK